MSRIPGAYQRAIQSEGAKINRWAQRTYGISGAALLAKLGMGESHFNRNAISSANAKGAYQFIPSTRNAILRQTGADAYGSPASATRAARIYLRQVGLSGYNPGMASYPSYILNQKVGAIGGSGAPRSSASTATAGAGAPADERAVVLRWLSTNRPGHRANPLSLVNALKGIQDTAPAQRSTPRGNRGGGGGKGGVVQIGKLAQKEGLHVGENPHFGGVHPVHVANSWHYKGRAIDVSGSPAAMRRFANQIAAQYGSRLKELFWNGSGAVNYKNGQRVGKGFVEGHTDHVHVAI